MSTNPPDSDQAALGRLLRRIEADADAAGWSDNGPALTLWVIYDRHDADAEQAFATMLAQTGPALRSPLYTARPMLPWQFFTRIAAQVPPYVQLRNFAVNLAYAPEQEAEGLIQLRQALALPAVRAFAACYEAWGQANLPAAALQAALRGDAHLVDDPASQEIRSLICVDVDDRAHRVFRVRGESAELHLGYPGTGSMTNSLRILTDAARDRTPDPDDFDARYPSLLDRTRGLDLSEQ